MHGFTRTIITWRGTKLLFPISKIIGDDLVEDQSVINNHIISFYKDLFAERQMNGDLDVVDFVVPKHVTEEENRFLLAVPSDEVIRDTVIALDPSSTPGPDGYNGSFY